MANRPSQRDWLREFEKLNKQPGKPPQRPTPGGGEGAPSLPGGFPTPSTPQFQAPTPGTSPWMDVGTRQPGMAWQGELERIQADIGGFTPGFAGMTDDLSITRPKPLPEFREPAAPPVQQALQGPQAADPGPLDPYYDGVNELLPKLEPVQAGVISEFLDYIDGLQKTKATDPTVHVTDFTPKLERADEKAPTSLGAAVLDVLDYWFLHLARDIGELPERAWWAAAQSGGWTFSAGPVGTDPYQSALLMQAVTGVPSDAVAFFQEERERYVATDVDTILRYWKEGEIAFSFAADPGSYERFLGDVADGMNMETAILRYEDFWPEFIGEVFTDPDWIIGGSLVSKIIFPLQIVLEPLVGAAGKFVKNDVTGFAKKLRETGALDWLLAPTQASIVRRRVADASDALKEAMITYTARSDVGMVKVYDDFLAGDFATDTFRSLSDPAQRRIQEAVGLMNQSGVRDMEGMIERYLPHLADTLTDEFLAKNPQYSTYVMSQAYDTIVRKSMGIDPNKAPLRKFMQFATGLWKEQMLGPNPGYILGNLNDNTTKSYLSGHFINPLDLNVPDRVAANLEGFGTFLPDLVDQGFAARELGALLPSKTARVPIPGIGKPSEIVSFWSDLTHIDFRANTWLGDIVSNLAPKRNLDEAVSIALLKSDTPVSWMASTLDKLNWAYVVERGADLSNAIERSARVQVYYDEVLGYIDNVARPALKTRAAEIGLPDGIARSFDGVFGPADILALKSKFAASEVPVVWASDLLPEGASDVLKGLAKEFDDYQKLIMQNFPEESVIQDMSEYIDELFTNTDGFTRNLDDAAQVEESLGEWWRGAMRGNVDNILQRSRDVRDDMLLTVRDRIAANPDAAGAYWTRYFAATNKVSREVWEEVVDITKRQMPTMSKSVDAMLTGYERSLADAIVPNMSTGDWGVFGEVLFERRQLVDGARDDMMNEFIKLLDDDSLTTVQAALDGVGNLADDAANKASVFRDGYLAQVQRAKPRITPEEYAAEMQRIWDESYFTPAREAFEAATQSITKGVGVGTPVQRAVPEEMADALDAQMDFEADMNLHNSSQYQQAAERMQQQALEWKNAVLGSLNDLARKISKGKIEVDTANTGIEELAKSWSGLMSDGRKAGALETANVLFDYSIKANWEEILGYFYPFTTWQTRNPNMWYQMTKNRPAIAGVVQRFNHLNQREMERNNLTSRFRGTVPVPGQEMLQAQGVLPEGSYAALNPMSLFSIGSQFQEPFESPAEDQLTGLPRAVSQARRIPGALGMTPYPWLPLAADMAIKYGNLPQVMGNNPPFGITGPVGRVIPQVREFERDVAEFRRPGQDWLQKYQVDRTLAEMVAEGQISPEEASAAQADESSALWQDVNERLKRQQQGLSTARFLQPFAAKYASPGERQIRDVREQYRGRPAAEAAFPRSQFPEQGIYSRAITGVDNPEYQTWAAGQDAVYSKYDAMLQQLPPWHPRTQEIYSARQEELDALGEAPARIDEQGYVVDDKREAVLYELSDGRPRAATFTDQVTGAVNWTQYWEAVDEYTQAVPEMGKELGYSLSVDEYTQFVNRYKSPEELAWGMRKNEQSAGWERYSQLAAQRIPQDFGVPDTLESLNQFQSAQAAQAGLQQPSPATLPQVPMRNLLGQLPPELASWAASAMTQRGQAGYGRQDLIDWAQGQKIPRDVIGDRLDTEGFGPQPLSSMQEQVMQERPWLRDAPMGSPEWGRWQELQNQMMPGMFRGGDANVDALLERYYSFLPGSRQQRDLREGLGFGGGETFSSYIKANPEMADMVANLPPMIQDQVFGVAPPKLEGLQAELERNRYFRGDGEWTDLTEKYFGGANPNRSAWWDLVGELILNDEASEDPVIGAMLDRDFRDVFDVSEDQYAKAVDYLNENKSRFIDHTLTAAAEEHPEWFQTFQEQLAVYSASSTLPESYGDYADLSEAEKERWIANNPNDWAEIQVGLNNMSMSRVANPFYTYFRKPELYKKWWGDTPPDEINVEAETASMQQAQDDFETYTQVRNAGGSMAWTPDMVKWFGSDDFDNSASVFWDYYFANKQAFAGAYRDDEIVQTALSKDIRDLIPSSAMSNLYREALKRLQSDFDEGKHAHFNSLPELHPQRDAEYVEFGEQFPFQGSFESDEARDLFFNQRTTFMRDHPVMTWFYYPEKYASWWGDMNPFEVDQLGPILGIPSGGGGRDDGGDDDGPPPPPPGMPTPPPPPGLPPLPSGSTNPWLRNTGIG